MKWCLTHHYKKQDLSGAQFYFNGVISTTFLAMTYRLRPMSRNAYDIMTMCADHVIFLHKCFCDHHHHFLDLAPKEIFMDRFRGRLSGENGAFVGS